MFLHHLLERFQTADNPVETLIEVPVQRAVRMDCVDEEVGAAVGKSCERMQKELLIGLGRGMVVQIHAARRHEFKRLVPGVGGKDFAPILCCAFPP